MSLPKKQGNKMTISFLKNFFRGLKIKNYKKNRIRIDVRNILRQMIIKNSLGVSLLIKQMMLKMMW